MKVINEITDDIKRFKSIAEFDAYYQKHKDDMDTQTTQLLNRIYKICTPDGIEYRITKRNCVKEGGKLSHGDIYLKRVINVKPKEAFPTIQMGGELKSELDDVRALMDEHSTAIKRFNQSISELNRKMDTLQSGVEKKINEITSTLNQMSSIINQLTGNVYLDTHL